MNNNKYNLGGYWRMNQNYLWEQCDINEIQSDSEKSFGVFEGEDCIKLDLLGMISVEEFIEKYRPYGPRQFGYEYEPIWH